MKNLLLSIFIIPSILVGSFLHSTYPDPTEPSDLRASKLFYNDIALTYKTTRYEQAGMQEMIDYIKGNNLDKIQATVNILPYIGIKNKWIYGDENGNFFPESSQWKAPEPDYILIPKSGSVCRTPPRWACNFDFIEGEARFENDFWILIKVK